MNRRGQIALLMIVLVALVLSITTLVVFTRFGADFKDFSLLNSKLVSGVDFGRVYVFAETQEMAGKAIILGGDVKSNFKVLASEKSKSGVEEAGNFFRKVNEGDFDFENIGGSYRLRMPGIIVQERAGNSEIQRTFDMCMLFDANGNYLSKGVHLGEYNSLC